VITGPRVWQGVGMLRRATPLLLLLALATACSGSDNPTVAGPSATPSDTPSETPSPTPSPTPSETPSATPSPTPSATPHRAVPARDRDVDGDGKPDSIRASATTLSVELSGSGRTVTAPVHTDLPGSPAILGTADVDRDGYAEVFLETAEGASTQFATPYRFDGTALHELQLDEGPARLGIGGSVTHGDGFACGTSGLLEVRGADSPDGATYTVHVDTYRLGTTALVLVKSRTLTAKQGDPDVDASYAAACGSVAN
jgi:hypothetical protein